MKSKHDLRFEIKVSIFLLGLALTYVALSLVGIDTAGRFYAAGKLKSTTFPYTIGAVFVITALYLLVKSISQYTRELKKRKTEEAKGVAIPQEEKHPFPFPIKAAVPPFGAFIIYIFALRYVGFLVGTVLLSMSMLFYMNKKNWLRNIVFSIAFPVLVYLLFTKVLNIRLPIGLLFGGR